MQQGRHWFQRERAPAASSAAAAATTTNTTTTAAAAAHKQIRMHGGEQSTPYSAEAHTAARLWAVSWPSGLEWKKQYDQEHFCFKPIVFT